MRSELTIYSKRDIRQIGFEYSILALTPWFEGPEADVEKTSEPVLSAANKQKGVMREKYPTDARKKTLRAASGERSPFLRKQGFALERNAVPDSLWRPQAKLDPDTANPWEVLEKERVGSTPAIKRLPGLRKEVEPQAVKLSVLRTQLTESGTWLDILDDDEASILSAHFDKLSKPDMPIAVFWSGAALREDLFDFFTDSVIRVWGEQASAGRVKVLGFGDSIEASLTGHIGDVRGTSAYLSKLDPSFPSAKLFRLEYTSAEGEPQYVVWARTIAALEARCRNATDMGIYTRPSHLVWLKELLQSFIESTSVTCGNRETVNRAVDNLVQIVQDRLSGKRQHGAV